MLKNRGKMLLARNLLLLRFSHAVLNHRNSSRVFNAYSWPLLTRSSGKSVCLCVKEVSKNVCSCVKEVSKNVCSCVKKVSRGAVHWLGSRRWLGRRVLGVSSRCSSRRGLGRRVLGVSSRCSSRRGLGRRVLGVGAPSKV